RLALGNQVIANALADDEPRCLLRDALTHLAVAGTVAYAHPACLVFDALRITGRAALYYYRHYGIRNPLRCCCAPGPHLREIPRIRRRFDGCRRANHRADRYAR